MNKLTEWVIGRVIANIPWNKVLIVTGEELDRFIMKFSEDTNMKDKVAIARLMRIEIDDILTPL